MADWYVGSVEYSAVVQWAASTAVSIGAIRRQLAVPAVGSERCWRCTTAGTTGSTEPTWNLTKGSTTSDNGVVWNEITGNSAYNWGAPHARLASALSWGAAGDNFYTSHGHAETQSTAITLAFPGTAASPNKVFCVSSAGAVPPVSTNLATTGALSSSGQIVVSGYAYVYGLTLTTGTGAASNADIILGTTAGAHLRFDGCSYVLTNIATGNVLMIGNGAGSASAVLVEWDNCTLNMASGSANGINLDGGNLVWRNTPSGLGASAPGVLFIEQNGATPGYCIVDGVDLSAAASGKTLVSQYSNGQIYEFINCKFGAGVTVAQAPTQPTGGQVYVVISDSGNATYRQEKYNYYGTLTTETVDIRVGGASDGITPIAWKVVTTANASPAFPFECPEIIKANSTTGSPITVSIAVMSNATLTNADIWLEAQYLGNASYPVASSANGRVGDLLPSTTPTAWPTDSVSSWTTTGVTGPLKQVLSVTLTPQQGADIRIKVKVGKASQTLRIDPLLQGF